MASPASSVEVITDPAALAALRPEWDALQRRARAPRLTQSFEWVWCAWEQIARPSGMSLYCVVVRREGRLAVVWPMVVRRRHLLWRAVAQLATDGDYADVLVEEGPGEEDLVRQAWLQVKKLKAAALIHLPLVRSDSLLKAVLKDEPCVALSNQTVTMVTWDGSPRWEDYWRAVSKSFRTDVDRRERRLADQGDLTFEVVTEPQAVQALSRWVLREKVDWTARKKIGRASWLQSPHYHRFLLAAPEAVSTFGRLIGFSLLLDGRLVAVHIDRVDGVRLEAMHITYDPAFARCSPGNVLMKRVAQWCFEQGLHLDLLFGDQWYKSQFRTAGCRLEDLSLACTRWGRAHHGVRDLWNRLEAQVRRRPQRARAAPAMAMMAAPNAGLP